MCICQKIKLHIWIMCSELMPVISQYSWKLIKEKIVDTSEGNHTRLKMIFFKQRKTLFIWRKTSKKKYKNLGRDVKIAGHNENEKWFGWTKERNRRNIWNHSIVKNTSASYHSGKHSGNTEQGSANYYHWPNLAPTNSCMALTLKNYLYIIGWLKKKKNMQQKLFICLNSLK